MHTEHSYWAILYFMSQWTRYYILIGAIRAGWVIEYGFPKWHPDPQDHNILDTIIREVQEETGIASDQLMIDEFDENSISFSSQYSITNRHNKEILKISTYYPIEMKYKDPLTVLSVPVDFVHEIHDIRIVPESWVIQTLTHDNDKKFFEQWILYVL